MRLGGISPVMWYLLVYALRILGCVLVGLQSGNYAQELQLENCGVRIIRESNETTNEIISQSSFCVTYEDVNEAFLKASARFNFLGSVRAQQNVKESTLAEVLLETTKVLKQKYSLSNAEIWGALPLLDTSLTLIGPLCPVRMSLLNTCSGQLSRYRTYDGSCNGEGSSSRFDGAANGPFPRFAPPDYNDGVEKPRRALSGRHLPDARLVSSKMHKDLGYHDHAITVMFLAWGQLLDHDITLTQEAKEETTQTEPDCCNKPRSHEYCAPLAVSFDDPFYSVFGQRCISFLRTPAALRPGCRLGPRAQNNELTGSIDASFVYGSTQDVAFSLRLFTGGEMGTLNILPGRLKPLLPLKIRHPDEGCFRPSRDIFCFLAGDNRVNEQLLLTIMHTIFVREHNRIARHLAQMNPHWTDETIYQETRMIVAAEVQQITYHEFLPVLLGRDTMVKYDLLLQETGYYSKYEKGMNPTVPASFAAAAFRFGHSLLPSTVERWSAAHRFIDSQRLSSILRQPFGLYRAGRLDQGILGMVNQVAQAMDDAVTSEVTNQLFRKPGNLFGRDLAAINIARGREHGIPSYTKFREICGLTVPKTWDEMSLEMATNSTTKVYSEIYQSVQDVDLWSAGISEKPVPDSLLGPTFSCILGRAFSKLRRADRFWFENANHSGAFTPGQLQSLRKARLARILCDNADDIATLQAYPLLLPDPTENPRLPCRGQVMPSLDLTPWKDLNS